MNKFEKKLLSLAIPQIQKIKLWLRFVDDCFVIVEDMNHDDLQILLETINSLDKNLKFTVETEKQGQLIFLDLMVSRVGAGLTYQIFRKPMHTDHAIDYRSNHRESHKLAFFHSAFHHSFIHLPMKERDFIRNLKLLDKLVMRTIFHQS